MRHYLLLGAGFSRNWGGWLASEVFEFLLGDAEVVGNSTLRTVLWNCQAKGGFEEALNELERTSGVGSKSYRALVAAVTRTFDAMNQAFGSKRLEFREPFGMDHPVRNFLLKFHSIFSLNQDLLLETCYRGSKDGYIDRTNPLTERDWQLPGMRLRGPLGEAPYPSATGIWVPSEERTIEEGLQPIFKLHGSSNWRSHEDDNMMIVGGGKARAIERHPVLKWYSEVFTDLLGHADTALMIVGYSFRDEHINKILVGAIEKGLRTFIVDPLGSDAAAQANSLPRNAAGYKLEPIEVSLQRSLIGASRRPLSSTFGDDGVERMKIERFLSL